MNIIMMRMVRMIMMVMMSMTMMRHIFSRKHPITMMMVSMVRVLIMRMNHKMMINDHKPLHIR